MVTHSRILAWRIPMDRGAWQAIVHGVVAIRSKGDVAMLPLPMGVCKREKKQLC